MAARDLPGLGLKGGYDVGENGWGPAMNNNLFTLSSVTQLVVESITKPLGVALTANGMMTIAPFGSGDDFKIAMLDEDIYKFLVPQVGWRAFIKDMNAVATWTGGTWFIEALPVSGGASFSPFVYSEEVVMAGAEVITNIAIPLVGTVLAVPVQVTEAITGATGFNVGIVGAPTQYGGPVGVALGSKNVGQTYSPVTYNYGGPIPIRLAAVGGDFTGGKVRVTILGWSIKLP